MKRYQRNLIVLAVAISVLVGVAVYNKDCSSDKVRSQVYEVIQKLPSYEIEKEYLDSIFTASHDSAFAAAYEYGRRRRAASFDAQKYVAAIFDNMSAKARGDGKEDLANELVAVKILLQASADKES
jgi:hypothetical protein